MRDRYEDTIGLGFHREGSGVYCAGAVYGSRATAEKIIESYNAWDDAHALTKRLRQLLLANPASAAVDRISHTLDLHTALAEKTPQQLVDIALDNLSANTTNESFALLVEEICTRLDPTWGERAEAEEAARGAT